MFGRTKTKGFSLAEILIVLGIMAILATVVVLNFSNSDTGAKENTLRANVATIREALDLYRSDHGWYPGDPSKDWNKKGKADDLVDQLMEFTDATGKPSSSKTSEYRFGPYLKQWPDDPFTKTTTIKVDKKNEETLSAMADRVSSSNGKGGWYYQTKTGNVCPNLGKSYPSDYANF
jgi:prepilin-type N-terminal cleavage/methylation domain-containing protein